MATYNFNARELKCSGLRNDALYSKQMAYDIAQSEVASTDSVKRHESLTNAYDRQDCGIQAALVYLVSRFDFHLCTIFQALWKSRRDMLHDWISDQLPKGAGKRGGEPALLVTLEHLWSGDHHRVSLEDYFEGEIHDLWNDKPPKKKLDALTKILQARFSPEVAQHFDEGLAKRNEIVHPHPHDWPSRSSRVKKSGRTRPELKFDWYDHVCDAFITIVEALDKKAASARSRNLATNVRDLRRLLSSRQRIVFGTYLHNSGQIVMPIETLFERIDKWSQDNEPPEAMILATSPDLAGTANNIREFARAHPTMGIIVYEWPWSDGLRGDALKELQKLAGTAGRISFVPQHVYPQGKYDQRYDAEVALQKLLKELVGV